MSKINDREFALVAPKWDNDGHKIDSRLVGRIAKKMARHFGGSNTYPSVVGCWKSDGKTICEENVVISSVRDTEGTSGNLNKQFGKDERFLKNLAKEAGKEFGQKWVTRTESKTEIDFTKGKFAEEIPKGKREKDIFTDIL